MARKKDKSEAPKLVINMTQDDNFSDNTKQVSMSRRKSHIAPSNNALLVPMDLPEGVNESKIKEINNKGKTKEMVANGNWTQALTALKRPSVMMKNGSNRRMSTANLA